MSVTASGNYSNTMQANTEQELRDILSPKPQKHTSREQKNRKDQMEEVRSKKDKDEACGKIY